MPLLKAPVKWAVADVLDEEGRAIGERRLRWDRPDRGDLSAASPLVYAYGLDIRPDQRAAVEIALHRWERRLGFVLARPMAHGDLTADVYIDAAPLEAVEYDPAEFEPPGVGVLPELPDIRATTPVDERRTHLEHVEWQVLRAEPWKIRTAVFLVETGRRREALVEPGIHGWGHVWCLDHPGGPFAHLAVMDDLLGGHIGPAVAEIEAVRVRYR